MLGLSIELGRLVGKSLRKKCSRVYQQRWLYFEGYILKVELVGFEDRLSESIGEKREIKNEFLVEDLCNQIVGDDIFLNEKVWGGIDRRWN